MTYLETWYTEQDINTENFKLSSLPTYTILENGPLQSYKDYIAQLPNFDAPDAFGQHGNADIASQIEDTMELLESILSVQPRIAAGGQLTKEEIVENMAKDLLDQVPSPLDLDACIKAKADDHSALHVVLFQEIERYNIMLREVRKELSELRKAVKGAVVMTSDLEDIFVCLFDHRIPNSWLKGYPSLKTLSPWARDLVERVKQLEDWSDGTYPIVFNMGYFTFPTGFLAAVFQTSARKNRVSIDMLSWEFVVNNQEPRDILTPPKEGVYVVGMHLEGGGWDAEACCLQEPNRMELTVAMPVIQFKPTENKKKTAKGVYACPCYYYPIRTGTPERPSYIITVDLKSGRSEADHWVKRGTALQLSIAS